MIFGSDNQAGASAPVLKAMVEAYTQTAADAYGADDYSRAGAAAVCEMLGTDAEVFFVSSGTAANMLALSAMVEPWEAIVCHHQAHILLDESTGPALFTGGAALLDIPDRTVRQTPEQLTRFMADLPKDVPHNRKATVFSLTQANECGQVYSVAEVEALARAAKAEGLGVHMDGARFANAVARLSVHPGEITWKAGVDVLCLGASKNGAVAAEAVVFFDTDLAKDFEYRMKRTGHLTSKARMYGAQFSAWLNDDHWLELAAHANDKADELRAVIGELDGVEPAWDCQSNESFVLFEQQLFDRLISEGVSMYDWYPTAMPGGGEPTGEEIQLARLVTSFATTSEQIEQFAELAAR